MSTESLAVPTTWRSETLKSHYQDVERVILEMRRHLTDNLSLEQLADVAVMTPFHFNRVFRCVTGIPPCRFLWMLRLEEAKALLLKTDRNVIDVCYDVGYSSLGTFTRRFTQLVGIPPLRFRRFATAGMIHATRLLSASLFEAAHAPAAGPHKRAEDRGVTALVSCPESIAVAVVGLFHSPVPYQAPVSCTAAASACRIRLGAPCDGRYFLFAAGLKHSVNPADFLLSDRILRGPAEDGVVEVRDGVCDQVHRITLRPPQLTDPPLLPCIPALIKQNGRDSVSPLPAV